MKGFDTALKRLSGLKPPKAGKALVSDSNLDQISERRPRGHQIAYNRVPAQPATKLCLETIAEEVTELRKIMAENAFFPKAKLSGLPIP